LLLIIAIRHGQGQKEALAKLQKLTILVTIENTYYWVFCVSCFFSNFVAIL